MVHISLLPVAALTLGIGHAAARAVPSLPETRSTCYLHGDPRNLTLTPFDCFTEQSAYKRALVATQAAPIRTYPDQRPNGPSIAGQQNKPSAFNFINKGCSIPSGQRSDYCEKAIAAFNTAGVILSNLFNIDEIINVDITLRPFGGQPGDSLGTLAFAGPVLTVPLVSDDGISRLYPAALVKQFGFGNTVRYSETDITVTVNSNPPRNADQTLYFVGDAVPARGTNTADFLSTILHEILHGMGFLSLFEYTSLGGNDIYRPSIDTNNNGDAFSFVEGIFDRYVPRLTAATQQGNQRLFPLPSSTQSSTDQSYIVNDNTVYNSFRQLGAAAVAPNTLPFVSNNQFSTFLETSLSPYKSGSSGSHISRDDYQQGADFLMTFDDLTTGSLAQQISDANGPILNDQQRQDATALAGIDLRLALGPNTRSIMQSLGWLLRTAADANDPAPTTILNPQPTQTSDPVIIADPEDPTTTTTATMGPSQVTRHRRHGAAAMW